MSGRVFLLPLSRLFWLPLLGACQLSMQPTPVGEAFEVAPAPVANLFELTDPMRTFVDPMRRHASERDRLRALLRGMLDVGLDELEYHPFKTQVAVDTFADRSGNCLSYTLLFVAFARELGLDVELQLLDVPPTWMPAGARLVTNNHINVRVRQSRVVTRGQRDFVVDFNLRPAGPVRKRRVLNAPEVQALYHANKAVEALAENALDRAEAHLHRALLEDRTLPQVWVNLGVLRNARADVDGAIYAHRRALALSPTHLSATTNLAALYERVGRAGEAHRLRKRARRYQDKNPYFHLSLAEDAYRRAAFGEALERLERAARRGLEPARLAGLRGLIALRQGDRDAARDYFAEASGLGGQSERELYRRKLELLSGT